MWSQKVMAAASVALLATVPLWAQAPAPAGQPPAAQVTVPRAADLGLIVFPANKQPPEQQQAEEAECFHWAFENTGIDPLAPAEAAPAAENQGADGSAVKGAAKGAAVGVAIGAIAGGAGEGAAIGAIAGGVRGRKKAKQEKKSAEQQAQAQAGAAHQERLNTFNKAMSACLEGKGYTVK